jgi:hypothetical protein
MRWLYIDVWNRERKQATAGREKRSPERPRIERCVSYRFFSAAYAFGEKEFCGLAKARSLGNRIKPDVSSPATLETVGLVVRKKQAPIGNRAGF